MEKVIIVDLQFARSFKKENSFRDEVQKEINESVIPKFSFKSFEKTKEERKKLKLARSKHMYDDEIVPAFISCKIPNWGSFKFIADNVLVNLKPL